MILHQPNSESAQLTGKSVVLRLPQPEDFAELIEMNKRSIQFHRGLVAPPMDQADFDLYMERSRRDDCRLFLIWRKTNPAIVGSINLSQIFRGGFQNAYLGYYVGAPYAGRGYATEALQLILRYAFKELKLHRIEANIQPGNVASVALVRRAGFVQEGFSRRYLKIAGRWRDHERWAITAEEWS